MSPAVPPVGPPVLSNHGHDTLGMSDKEHFGKENEDKCWELLLQAILDESAIETQGEIGIQFIKTRTARQSDGWSCGYRTALLIKNILIFGYHEARRVDQNYRRAPAQEVSNKAYEAVAESLKTVFEQAEKEEEEDKEGWVEVNKKMRTVGLR